MSGASGDRWAVYFAPAEDTALWRFGVAWLGRDPVAARDVPQPLVDDVDPFLLRVVTDDPRFYGFHATLKPPFALAPGRDADGLIAAAEAFAARRTPFAAGPLRISRIGRFMALTLTGDTTAMDDLAADAVRAFDEFRAPPSADDLARRRGKGLTARQDELLQAWGYPYVMEEFRFHMTLTGGFDDEALAARLAAAVEARVGGHLAHPLPVDGICLYHQPDRATPFRLARRIAFRG